jgi:gliding motility-associated-like protein
VPSYAQNAIPPTVITDTTICKGESIDLNDLIVKRGDAVTLNWYKIPPPNSGKSPIPIYDSVIFPTDTSEYRLVYQLSDGETGRASVIISIADMPEIQVSGDVSLCVGDELTLKVVSTTYADSIWWEWLGTNNIYADGTSLIPDKEGEKEDYQITFRVYALNNVCGKRAQKNVKVDVKIPLDGKTLKVKNEYTFCVGEIVDLTNLIYFTVSNVKGKEYSYHPGTDSEISGFNVSWKDITNPSAYKINNDVTLIARFEANVSIPNDCQNISQNFSNQELSVNLKVEGTKPSLSHQSVVSSQNYYPYVICKNDVVEIAVLSGSCGTIDTVEWVSPAIKHSDRIEATPSQWKYSWSPTAATTFKANIKTKSLSDGTITTETATIAIDVKDYPKLVAITDTTTCNNIEQTIDLNDLLNKNVYIGLPDWGDVNPTLVNPKESNTYHVKATSAYRCQDMENYDIEGDINLHINTLMDITAMADTAICKGSPIALTAESQGSVYWTKSIGGSPISSMQTPIETTTYYANVKNVCGIATDSVLVSINITELKLRSDTVICKNEPVDLYAVDFDGDSILWEINDQWINSPKLTVNAEQTTMYRAKGYKNTCEALATVTVKISPTPDLQAMDDLTVCRGESVKLTAQSNASVSWNVPNTTVTIVSDTSFYVTASNDVCTAYDTVNIFIAKDLSIKAMADTTICQGSSLTLTAESTGEVYWSKSIGGTAISATQSPNATTVYYGNAFNSCATAVDSVTVNVNLPPILKLRADTIVCSNEPVDLCAVDFNGDSILWNINNQWINKLEIIIHTTETTIYSAKGFRNGCETLAMVTITIKPTPVLKAMDDLTVCMGETVKLTAQSDSPITWNVSNTIVTPVSDTSFYVMASNGTCEAYDTVNITMSLPPSVIAMGDKFVCYGEMLTLTVISGEGDISWNVPSTTFRATQTATYTVTATNTGCGDATDEVTITVGDSLYINPDKLPRYKRGASYDVSLITNAKSPNFTITDGNLPTGFILTTSGAISGITSDEGLLEKSTFTVEVTDVDGCSVDKDYLLEGEVFISEVFTPNGDGFNDHFMEGCHVIIYNRLGVKLFEGDNGWDGTYKGMILPPDTYFYTVTIVNEEGKKEKKSGPISIVKR